MYKIIGITKGGRTRTDGRYPMRIGCVGSPVQLEIDHPMLFQYYRDSNGNYKEGTLATSSVVAFKQEDNVIVVVTMNSTYTLWEIIEEENHD